MSEGKKHEASDNFVFNNEEILDMKKDESYIVIDMSNMESSIASGVKERDYSTKCSSCNQAREMMVDEDNYGINTDGKYWCYSYKYDSFYCHICKIWVDKRCSDVECEYCTKKPEIPDHEKIIEYNKTHKLF